MIGYIAVADGAPCPTLVLDTRDVPEDRAELTDTLIRARAQLRLAGHADVLKIALIAPSAHPLFDLTYRFVQCIPGADGDRFDFLGSCGHSIVASTMVANQLGWIRELAPGHRVRVKVDNNGDTVVCEVDEMHRNGGNVTVHFLQDPVEVERFLVTGSAVDTLRVASQNYAVSVVDMGNPYVFVRAGDLRIGSQQALFADDPQLFDTLVAIRRAAAARWGWPADSAFPKVAAIDHFTSGAVSVRAVSVPKWHPTLALTGATCLAVATVIPGTVAHQVARDAGCEGGEITMQTPGGPVVGRPMVIGTPGNPQLCWVSVSGKRARHVARISFDLPVARREIRELAA